MEFPLSLPLSLIDLYLQSLLIEEIKPVWSEASGVFSSTGVFEDSEEEGSEEDVSFDDVPSVSTHETSDTTNIHNSNAIETIFFIIDSLQNCIV